MNVRDMTPADLPTITDIHNRHYKDQFDMYDFVHGIRCPIIIEENNDIVLAAGMREIVESVAITNKDLSVRARREALLLALRWMIVKAREVGQPALHCFIQDDSWMDQLKRYGFKPTRGESLILKL